MNGLSTGLPDLYETCPYDATLDCGNHWRSPVRETLFDTTTLEYAERLEGRATILRKSAKSEEVFRKTKVPPHCKIYNTRRNRNDGCTRQQFSFLLAMIFSQKSQSKDFFTLCLNEQIEFDIEIAARA